jgi:hypothetical protein
MKKITLLLGLTILFAYQLNAQVALAKLKFEDAESEYNNGKYANALTKLKDAERLFGKVNPPILHLKILIQDKLFQNNSEDYNSLFDLQKNCAIFLRDYADVEGLEEKFRDVYRISERYNSLPKNQSELDVFIAKKNKEKEAKRALIKKVLQENLDALGGELAIQKIKTLSYHVEQTSKTPVPEGQRVTLSGIPANATRSESAMLGGLEQRSSVPQTKSAETGKTIYSFEMSRKLEIGKRSFSETTVNYLRSFQYLSRTEGYEKQQRSQKKDFSRERVLALQENLYAFESLYLIDNIPDSIDISETSALGEAAFLLKYKKSNASYELYYSKDTKLLLVKVMTISIPEEPEIKNTYEILSYLTEDGIKFPSKGKISFNGANTITVQYNKIRINPNLKDKDFED